MNNWQPIETAPKDAYIQVFVHIPFLSNGRNFKIVSGTVNQRGVFYSDPGAYKYKPTHWQPLPEPPR